MVNFRVRNLDAMAAQLRAAGIEVKIDPEEYPNGRFARLSDPERNPVELWKPNGRDAPSSAR
jgi:glyoxylase I family protein